jgi:hypothetical protein
VDKHSGQENQGQDKIIEGNPCQNLWEVLEYAQVMLDSAQKLNQAKDARRGPEWQTHQSDVHFLLRNLHAAEATDKLLSTAYIFKLVAISNHARRLKAQLLLHYTNLMLPETA